MRKHLRMSGIIRFGFMNILFSTFILSSIMAQVPADIQRTVDEFYTELVKIYKIIESEEVELALKKIDTLTPSLENKARKMAEQLKNHAGFVETFDSEEYQLLILEKPYYKEMMRILTSESFIDKMRSNTQIQVKLEALNAMLESYLDVDEEPVDKGGALPEDAFTITLTGNGPYSGKYTIQANHEDDAVAFIDDLGYLRIEILGEVDGMEAGVSFFVENNGSGRQEWTTDGHFIFELTDKDGEVAISLWGSEDMGYFDVQQVEIPEGFVSGRIVGECIDNNSESEKPVSLEATFRVRFMEDYY